MCMHTIVVCTYTSREISVHSPDLRSFNTRTHARIFHYRLTMKHWHTHNHVCELFEVIYHSIIWSLCTHFSPQTLLRNTGIFMHMYNTYAGASGIPVIDILLVQHSTWLTAKTLSEYIVHTTRMQGIKAYCLSHILPMGARSSSNTLEWGNLNLVYCIYIKWLYQHC